MKTKILIGLVILGVMDTVIPIPFTALLLIYVVLERPSWFQNVVRGVYEF